MSTMKKLELISKEIEEMKAELHSYAEEFDTAEIVEEIDRLVDLYQELQEYALFQEHYSYSRI